MARSLGLSTAWVFGAFSMALVLLDRSEEQTRS
jgi:hypothetical protein